MARTRQQNVTAAQWTANGAALGAPDLTEPGSYPFGENVFNVAVQKERLPKDVFKQLQATLDRGEALDPSLADAVAKEMREWAMEHGATHFTHWFQPLTNSTAEKHDSFYEPAGDGTAIAGFSGKELIQGEPDASSFPTGGVRATFEARGYTAWDPTSPAFIIENPNGALLCIPTAFASWTGEALDTKIPLLRSMDALSTSAIRALKLLGDEAASRVFTTVGPEQEYFFIDEQYYFERPDLYTTGRTLFGAKPPKGHELDDHYFGSIPERILACMLETEHELAKLGVPTKTRHNEVAPNQYELAPIFENSNVGADHQQLTMQIMQNVARRYGLVCLLHEKPYAGVNGSGKHNNWSMGTDSGLNLLEPGDTPHENISFLFFCAAVIAAVNTPPGAAARERGGHRPGPPPGRQRGAAGDHLDLPRRRAEQGLRHDRAPARATRRRRARSWAWARRCCRRCRCTAAIATGPRRSPSPATSSSSAPWAPASRSRCPTRSSTRSWPRPSRSSAPSSRPPRATARTSTTAVVDIVRETYSANKQVCFDGDNYDEAWHAEAEKRGLANLRTTPDALPWLVEKQTIATFERYKVLSERELESRFEVMVEQYTTRLNIEAETAASIARTMLLPAAIRHLSDLKAAGHDALVAETQELVGAFYDAILALEKANEDHPAQEGLELASWMRDNVVPAMDAARDVADRLERIVADDLWPLPKYSEMLFIK